VLDFEACGRVWDKFIIEGEAVLYRVAVAILAILEPQLTGQPLATCMRVLQEGGRRGQLSAVASMSGADSKTRVGGRGASRGGEEGLTWARLSVAIAKVRVVTTVEAELKR
jgi:TBC1 domain family member 14